MQSTALILNKTIPQSVSEIESAISRTVAYADLFDYPLTAVEIQRFLEMPASLERVESFLTRSQKWQKPLSQVGRFFMLPGRESLVKVRQRRALRAKRLWPEALRYGRLMAAFPFVRMVAVTGSLAVNNPNLKADIDYLIVTTPGRLWLCRASIISLVRLAARRGIHICPNYFITENNLHFTQHNLYTAHEIAQMVPLTGIEIYNQLRQSNAWTGTFLPNASLQPLLPNPQPLTASPWPPLIQSFVELPFRTPLGRWLDQWEMRRKIRKFQTQYSDLSETRFSADCCKGHFDKHQQRTESVFAKRVKENME